MKRINLLPQEQKVRASRERGLIYAIFILVAVVVVLGLVYMKYNSEVSTKNQQLADVQSQTAAMEQQKAALQPYAALQTKRTAMTETAKNLYAAGVPFSIILQEISLVIPDNVWITSFTVDVPDAMQPGVPVAPTAAASIAADISIMGSTDSHRAVAKFMTRLGMMPQLRNINLVLSQTAASTTTTVGPIDTTFQISASLRPYVQAPPTMTATGEAQ